MRFYINWPRSTES